MPIDKNTGKKLIVISGYFDPIHVGHIEYMKLASELGDKLIVILNNDAQAILKKGKPFMNEAERKTIIESLIYPDEVILSIDKDESVCKTIEHIWANYVFSDMIFAKGGDRFNHEIPEALICKRLGIEIVDRLGEKIQSSSSLINNSISKK